MVGYDPDANLLLASVAAPFTLGLAAVQVASATVRDLTRSRNWARAEPAAASFRSPGVGSLPHLLPTKLFAKAGADPPQVPSPDGPPPVVDLLAGLIAVLEVPSVAEQPRTGCGEMGRAVEHLQRGVIEARDNEGAHAQTGEASPQHRVMREA